MLGVRDSALTSRNTQIVVAASAATCLHVSATGQSFATTPTAVNTYVICTICTRTGVRAAALLGVHQPSPTEPLRPILAALAYQTEIDYTRAYAIIVLLLAHT